MGVAGIMWIDNSLLHYAEIWLLLVVFFAESVLDNVCVCVTHQEFHSMKCGDY